MILPDDHIGQAWYNRCYIDRLCAYLGREMNVARESRHKEHSRAGHRLRDATDDVERQNMDCQTRRFFKCSCGWFGWLTV